MAGSAGAVPPTDMPGRGIAFMLAAVSIFSMQDAMVKWLTADYSVMQIMFFRGVFGLIPCSFLLWRAGGRRALRTRRLTAHIWRSGLILGALITFFLAISKMPLADVVAIAFSAPLIMTALSMPLLGERVEPRRWAAVMVGFVGVLIVVHPGVGVFGSAALLALASSVLFAVGMTVTRKLTRSEHSATILFYFTLLNIAAGGIFMPFLWVTPTLPDAAMLVTIGFTGGFAAFCMFEAFRFAPIAVVAPFEYSSLIWATLYGYLIWGDVPGSALLAGAGVIVASNLYIVHREARQPSKHDKIPRQPV
jgi:drug/metabolite transporter (DMT)-like permease